MNHNVIIVIALIIVVISMLAMLIRVVLGPSLADDCRYYDDWYISLFRYCSIL